MRMRFAAFLSLATLLPAAAAAQGAEGLPTTQPPLLQIFRETIKPGMAAAHEANERGWPQAFARAGSKDYYLAMESLTGPLEVWYVAPFASYTAMGKAMDSWAADKSLAAEMARLSTADGPYLEDVNVVEAVAAPGLGHGNFPDLTKQRYWQISIWRIRPGHDDEFAAATAAYKKIVDKVDPNISWRVYRVTGGMPAGTVLIFSSEAAFGDFDTMMAQDQKIGQAFTKDDQAFFKKFFSEAMAFGISNKYRLSPTMSYVSDEVKATDPDFWGK